MVLNYPNVEGSEAGGFPSALYGSVPPGTTSVSVRLADGRVVDGVLADGQFAAVLPQGDITHTTVVSRGVAATVATTGGLQGSSCGDMVASLLAAADVPGLAAPQHLFDAGPSDPWLHIYGSADVLAMCFGDGIATLWAYPPDVQVATRYAYSECMVGIGHLAGAVPGGTTGAEVVLANGTRVPATVRDGFYFALWPGDVRPVGVTLQTPAGTQTTPVDGGRCPVS